MLRRPRRKPQRMGVRRFASRCVTGFLAKCSTTEGQAIRTINTIETSASAMPSASRG